MKTHEEDGTLILAPETNLVASTIEEIRSFVMQQLKNNRAAEQIKFDVKGINIVDSLGVNLIIGLYRQVTAESKKFAIVNAGEKFMKMANFFRFNALFPVEREAGAP